MPFLFFRKELKLLWCVRDGWKQGQTAILTHNFFSWPYHAVLSSRPHLALLFLSQGYSTEGSERHSPPGGALSDCKLWLRPSLTPTDKQASAFIISERPQLPINHVTVSLIYTGASMIYRLGQGQYTTQTDRHIIFIVIRCNNKLIK